MAYLPPYKQLAKVFEATHNQLKAVAGRAGIDHIIETCELLNKNKLILWQLQECGALDSAEHKK